MDRLLKPEKLTADPTASDSRQVNKHWLRTFERFITAVEAACNEDDPEMDKYGLLVNYISSDVYAYVEETIDYEEALTLLERVYVKPRNTVMP